MALNIRNPETEQLAASVAEITGETKTEAVRRSLAERLDRLRRERSGRSRLRELRSIANHCASLPVLDDRCAEEILGYGENGLPA